MSGNLCFIIIETIVILLIIKRKCFVGKKIIINHFLCFSVGFFYYAVLPVLVYELRPDFDDFAYRTLLSKYWATDHINIIKYLIISSFIYLAFIFGSSLKVINRSKVRMERETYFTFSEKVYFIPVVCLGAFLIMLNGNFLFKGYTGQKNMNKGSLSAYLIVVLSFLLFYVFSSKDGRPYTRFFKCKWGVLFIFTAAILLTMGGRLYVLSSFFALIIAYMIYRNYEGIQLRRFGILFIGVMFLSGWIGLLRKGINLNIRKIAFNILQEPIYTSYSLVTYLRNNNINKFFSFPSITLRGFVNIIPYKIFPQKLDYILSVFSVGHGIEAPLGATHFFPSFILDYGIVGAIVFFFVMGRIIAFLNLRQKSYLSKTVYCLLSANLMFTIFRDSIPIAIIKNIIEFSICIPLLLYYINRLFEKKK